MSVVVVVALVVVVAVGCAVGGTVLAEYLLLCVVAEVEGGP